MQFSKQNYAKCTTKEFNITGCKKPSEQEPHPQLFTANVFAPNSVVAQSKFFRMLTNQYKIKAKNGAIVRVEEVQQDDDFTVKNYGITFTYRTRTGLCNGYKEIRHLNRALAIHDLYMQFGSKHKLKQGDFYIVEIKQLADDEVTKSRILSYVGKDVKFPVFHKESNVEAETVPVTADIFN